MTMPHMKPIMLDFPDGFESERLLIRAPRFGDGAVINEAVSESLQELRPWMPWAQEEPAVGKFEQFAREGAAYFAERRDLRLLLFDLRTGAFVGSSGLHQINWGARKFEIGYWIRSRMTGSGYATEAARAIAEFAFQELGANRVEIRCDERNERSANVARRAGFSLEGILRNDSLDMKGKLSSTMVFARLREEI